MCNPLAYPTQEEFALIDVFYQPEDLELNSLLISLYPSAKQWQFVVDTEIDIGEEPFPLEKAEEIAQYLRDGLPGWVQLETADES